MVQRECCLDQAGDTGRGFQVAKVRLDRAKRTARSSRRPSASTDPSGSASIGSPRSVPVPCARYSLPVRHAGLAVGIAEHGFLGRFARRGQTVRSSILVDRTPRMTA